jgi:hypothetical protein
VAELPPIVDGHVYANFNDTPGRRHLCSVRCANQVNVANHHRRRRRRREALARQRASMS